MAYFDYLDNGKVAEMRDTQFMETWARISAWISLICLGLFLIPVILFCFFDINVYFWFAGFNLIGVGLGIFGIIIDTKTLGIAKSKRITTAVGNMALALNILWLLLNLSLLVAGVVIAII